jgi:hypothetical protein
MDWETLYCPHRHCRGYGKPFSQGYLVKNGTSRGQPRAQCTACEASVVLSYGTAYYGLEADPVVFETAASMCWSSGMASSPMGLASCPSRSLNLVCKMPIGP